MYITKHIHGHPTPPQGTYIMSCTGPEHSAMRGRLERHVSSIMRLQSRLERHFSSILRFQGRLERQSSSILRLRSRLEQAIDRRSRPMDFRDQSGIKKPWDICTHCRIHFGTSPHFC